MNDQKVPIPVADLRSPVRKERHFQRFIWIVLLAGALVFYKLQLHEVKWSIDRCDHSADLYYAFPQANPVTIFIDRLWEHVLGEASDSGHKGSSPSPR